MATISAHDQKNLEDISLITVTLPEGMVHLQIDTARNSPLIFEMIKDMGMLETISTKDQPDTYRLIAKVNLNYENTPKPSFESIFKFGKMHANVTAEAAKALAVVPGQTPAPTEDEKDPKNGELADWENKFFNELTKNDTDLSTLFNFIMAANYFGMEVTIHRAAKKIADLIKGKTPEQIRATFSIPADAMAHMGLVAQ